MKSPSYDRIHSSLKTNRFLYALVVVGLCAHCGFEETGSKSPTNRCESDSDCPGSTCFLDTGFCVGGPDDNLSFEIELAFTGPKGTPVTTLVESFLARDSSATEQERVFQIPKPVQIYGTISLAGDETRARVSAEVSFTRVYAGGFRRSVRSAVTTSPDPLEGEDGGAIDYNIELIPDTYEVLVQPTGSAASVLPPKRVTLIVPNYSSMRFDLEYRLEQLREVTGQVVQGQNTPLSNVFVRAVDQNQQLLSSVTSTSSEENLKGFFRIRMDSSTENFLLRLNASPEGPLVPTFSVPSSYLAPAGLSSTEETTVRVVAPDIGRPLTYQAIVKRDDDTPMPQAAVMLRASTLVDSETQIVGTLQLSTKTDDSGEVSTQVLPGTYEVIVTPTTEGVGVYAASVSVAEGPPHPDKTVIYLSSQTVVTGRLVSRDGRGVGNVSVQAIALSRDSDSRGTIVARYNRSSATAFTDANGYYRLLLDEGRYDVVFRTPVEQGFPWFLIADMEVSDAPIERDPFEPPTPFPVLGRVVYEDNTPIMGAEVRAYVAVRDGKSPARPVSVAQATTDSEGRYMLLLPTAYHLN